MNKSIKDVRLFLVAVFLLVPSLVVADSDHRVYERDGGFSYVLPSGWNVRELPGLKYKGVFGPEAGGFAANIVFVDEMQEMYDGNLRGYVDHSFANMALLVQGFELLKREHFTTASGVVGERVTTNSGMPGFPLRQIYYILPVSGGRYFVITCSVHRSAANKYQPIFETSIKTFRLEGSDL